MLGNPAWERALLAHTYDGCMTVTGARKQTVDGETIVTPNAVLYENQPCALSKSRDAQTRPGENAAATQAACKLFCAPGLAIPPGSRITVTQYGTAQTFRFSGEAFAYPTHQELTVQREGWA